MLKNELKIDYKPPASLKAYKYKIRTLGKEQIKKTRRLIEECGFVIPVIIDQSSCIVTGDYLVEAANNMNMEAIPVICVDHLTPEQIRVLRIAHDRIAEDSKWDKEQLAIELKELEIIIPDLTITGFDQGEIDITFDVLGTSGKEDIVPEPYKGMPTCKEGDLWLLGDHKLFCGDSLKAESYESLMGEDRAHMVFTDSPYNVKIDGHVGGKGSIKHGEFAMASGEMSEAEFTNFLTIAHKNMAAHSVDGAIIFSCMDWRHIREIMDAARYASFSMVNMCAWVKNNGGMGSLYRSQHELIFVFKNGKAKHINNVQLGSNGRYRTNVWEYPGVNTFGGRSEELEMHPTVKPVAMVEDAIKDCSRRGNIILDPFGGSGTTLIAAENTNRKARLIELDPKYCDVIIRRWRDLTGKDAIHADSKWSFNETVNTESNDD